MPGIKKARLFLDGLLKLDGADTTSRTRDLLITSQLLYQLSYVGTNAAHFIELRRLGQPLFYDFFKLFNHLQG